jgi:hypothetical protein
VGAGGAVGGIGGMIVGAGLTGSVADGMAGGASEALRVKRTVSFFKGILDVCFDGTLDVCLDGVLISFSLMRLWFFAIRNSKDRGLAHVKPASLDSRGTFKKRSGENPLEHPEQAS